MITKFKKIMFAAVATVIFAIPTVVSASSWYGATITLPRAGTSWWATVTRTATSNVQGIKASQNKYQIVGNIATSGDRIIGDSWKTFNAYNNVAQYVTTNAKGSKIKAVFQTNRYNLYTTTGYLEWRP